MRVLVTWGSKRGGTEGIARSIAEVLRQKGFEVELVASRDAMKVEGFDAAIVGGALYAGLWHRAARRFVTRRAKDLRGVPVWFFSSGPLDDSADRVDIPPTPQVKMLMNRAGAIGHVTFGGRLAADARGFPAAAMAKEHSGDWRNDARIRAWAEEIARAVPAAQPRHVSPQRGGSIGRLVAHGVVGWAACGVTMAGLLRVASAGVATAIHAAAAPLIFAFVALHYFRAPGARSATVTALTFATLVALLDLVVVANFVLKSFAMFGSLIATWLPFALIFLVTWGVGHWIWLTPPSRAAARPA